ncbi:MAG: TetR/AcrR family transcriptional regulator [Alphaproteobacteria bacterium]|nr:TetR/AcrR family transcriptional regulator [Alphaproteobacteria bacterium]
MPRAKSHSRTTLVDSALTQFWKTGYHVISMGDLVRETGVSRGSIYSDFSGKQALFHACLERYQALYVTPAFGQVEADGAGLQDIRNYIEMQLRSAADSDQPILGCLVANTLAQLDPDEIETREKLEAHYRRLTAGFTNVFARENASHGLLSEDEISALAGFTTVSVQGLWTYARTAPNTDVLFSYADVLLTVLHQQLHGVQN